MITNKNSIIIYILLSLLLSIDLYPQKKEEPVNRILFVFDASQSMLGRWQSGRKIDIAKTVQENFFKDIKIDIVEKDLDLRSYRLNFDKMKKFFDLSPASDLIKESTNLSLLLIFFSFV